VTSTALLAVADAAFDHLAALPTSASEIAALFDELNIRGVRESACACPIARYVGEVVPSGFDVSVCSGYITIVDVDGWDVEAQIPDHVGNFVNLFDINVFPLLEVTA
jgi:hypothetical protein